MSSAQLICPDKAVFGQYDFQGKTNIVIIHFCNVCLMREYYSVKVLSSTSNRLDVKNEYFELLTVS